MTGLSSGFGSALRGEPVSRVRSAPSPSSLPRPERLFEGRDTGRRISWTKPCAEDPAPSVQPPAGANAKRGIYEGGARNARRWIKPGDDNLSSNSVVGQRMAV